MKNIVLKIIAPLLAIIGILAFITALHPIKQQDASSRVFQGGNACGIHVQYISESACNSNTGSYAAGVELTATDGKTHQVQTLFENFWCKSQSELGDGVNPASCIKRDETNSPTVTVGPGHAATVFSPTQSSTSRGFNACGVYQTDFSFTVGSCRFGFPATDPNPNHPVMADSYCNTHTTCAQPTPTPTPAQDCDGDHDNSIQNVDSQCMTPTDTPVPTSTPFPTATPTPTTVVNTTSCGNTTQNGTNNNSNCNQQNQSQSQNQTQNNNQSVNITLGNNTQPQQQVLAAATAPTQLPNTGAESNILLGLLALIPVGWKIRKLI